MLRQLNSYDSKLTNKNSRVVVCDLYKNWEGSIPIQNISLYFSINESLNRPITEYGSVGQEQNAGTMTFLDLGHWYPFSSEGFTPYKSRQIMDRDTFKNQWKELRVAGVTYSSLTEWLKIISKLKESGISDEEITTLLKGIAEEVSELYKKE